MKVYGTQAEIDQAIRTLNRPRSKYGAQPEMVDNVRFDSRREAARYGDLKLLLRAKKIADLELQPAFPLDAPVISQATGEVLGLCRVGEYRADFRYRDLVTREVIVEDAKGVRTAMYSWKKRHVQMQYGIVIREV